MLKMGKGEELEGSLVMAGEVLVLGGGGGLVVSCGVRSGGLVVGWWCFLCAGEVRGGATGV